jgi:hypothetical protein
MDWCLNNATSTHTQIIEVLDHTPPVVNSPADFTGVYISIGLYSGCNHAGGAYQ